MQVNRIPTRHAAPRPEADPRRGVRDRRFEALYMQSFVDMRARNPKG